MSTIGITLITNSSSDPDVDAYLNATRLSNTQYYATKRNAVSTLVSSLKDASIWDSIRCIYPFVETNRSLVKNLKDTTLYNPALYPTYGEHPDLYSMDQSGLVSSGNPAYGVIGLNVRFEATGNAGCFVFTTNTTSGAANQEGMLLGVQQGGVCFGFERNYSNQTQIGYGAHGTTFGYGAMAGYHMVARDANVIHWRKATSGGTVNQTFSVLVGSNNMGLLTNGKNGGSGYGLAANLGIAGIFTNTTPINYDDLRTIVLAFLTTMGRY